MDEAQMMISIKTIKGVRMPEEIEVNILNIFLALCFQLINGQIAGFLSL